MCDTSNRADLPSPRHHRCSFMTPPFSPLYRTGSSYPAKGTMSPRSSLWRSFRAVLRRGSSEPVARAREAEAEAADADGALGAARRRRVAAAFIVIGKCEWKCGYHEIRDQKIERTIGTQRKKRKVNTKYYKLVNNNDRWNDYEFFPSVRRPFRQFILTRRQEQRACASTQCL